MTQKENNGSQPYDDYKVPEYRVRLFLSVDLTGSTAYKHSHKNPLEGRGNIKRQAIS